MPRLDYPEEGFPQGYLLVSGLNYVWDVASLDWVKETQPGGGGGGGAVTVADGADVAEGATTDAEATGNGSVIAILKRVRTLLNGGLPAALGQGTMAQSLRVVLPSDQSAVAVSGTVTSNQGTAAAGTAGWPITAGNTARVSAAWTSATALDTTLSLSVTGYPASGFTLNSTTPITAGGLNFEVSDDGGTTWFTIGVTRTDTGNTESTYTIPASTKQGWQLGNAAYTDVRIRLNPAITGAGTVTVAIRASAGATDPSVSALLPDIIATAVAMNALNVTATVALQGRQSVSASLAAGTLAATLSFEQSLDGGTTWAAVVAYFPAGNSALSVSHNNPNIASMYSISPTGGATHVRVRVSAYTSGTANLTMRAVFLPNTFTITRPSFSSTYTASYMLATRPFALSNAFVAAGSKQYATIYHPNTSVKTVRIVSVRVWVQDNSVAAKVSLQLRKLVLTTAPATGNPAITPLAAGAGSPAAEATCLALPTTAGAELSTVSIIGQQELDLGVTGAASVINPPPVQPSITLWPPEFTTSTGNIQGLTMIPGVAEGWAVVADVNAATTLKLVVVIVFTEE